LKRIEQDGTFDQLKPLKVLADKQLPFYGSYDLSAATDRLPIDLQVDVLSCIITREFAEAWRDLLVGRDYLLKVTGKYKDFAGNYRYAVGQPMGALSS
jgi:hypothetical protein